MMSNEATDIFVFGSNLAGFHGAGAARFAVQRHGAIYGQGITPANCRFAETWEDGE